MKTPEELNALREEVEALNKKLNELTDDELSEIFGGTAQVLPATHLDENSVVDDDIHGGIIYNNSDPAFNKPIECMFGAPAIIK